MTKTIILVDNQDITRAGLHYYLGSTFSTHKVLEVTDKKQLTDLLLADSNAVVVLDYTNTGFNSTDELLNLSKRFESVNWILFSNDLSEPVMKQMSLYDNYSMVLKDCSGNEILDALRSSISGKRYICHHIANLLINSNHRDETLHQLTQSEIEILKLIAHGKTVKEIAQLRNSSYHTIVTHKKNIFRKLEVNTVYEATKYALKAGLLEIVEYYI